MKSAFRRVVDAVHKNLGDKTIEFAVGSAQRAVHGAKRRVVWVRQGGALRTPRMPGAFKHPSVPNVLVKPLYDNALTVFAYISAEGEGELERVWCDVLNAVRLTLGSSSTAGTYGFPDEETAGLSKRQEYDAMVQPFEWLLLIAERGDVPTSSTVSGTRTFIVLGFDTDHDILPEST